MTDAKEPFVRDEAVDDPGIVGARWWHESLRDASATLARRSALRAFLIAGGVLAGLGAIIALGASSCRSDDDVAEQPRPSLEMQKEYGWNFGAATEPVTFDGRSMAPFDRTQLKTIDEDLKPAQAALLPFYVRTLFQAPVAMPRSTPPGDPVAFTPVMDVLVPISTAAMDAAYARGQALGALFRGVPNTYAVIVDLPGPEAVAFAAGALPALDPVFLFDNWPHPRGVVNAHLTLAAAAFYQPAFVMTVQARVPGTRPLFVLDRDRLAAYADDATQFDNRYVARVPSAPTLSALGVRTLLYVHPTNAPRQELDDLSDFFSAAQRVRIALKTMRVDAPSWGDDYTPTPRSTAFVGGQRPTNFGTVPVVVAVATGVILGAKMSRSGSWNRTSFTSGWGGG